MSRLLIFNKPCGVICQFSASPPHLTLADFISVPNVYPVGRLDTDSEGLLLLTDNGAWQHRIAHPDFGKSKTYWAQVEGQPNDEQLEMLRRGVVLKEFTTRPAQVKQISPPTLWPRHPPIRTRLSVPTAWLELVLTEGKNRQVRRMTAAVGLPTLRLVRVAVGGIRLNGLEVGAWREATPTDIAKLLPPQRRSSVKPNRRGRVG